jgi:hypothetical protein
MFFGASKHKVGSGENTILTENAVRKTSGRRLSPFCPSGHYCPKYQLERIIRMSNEQQCDGL